MADISNINDIAYTPDINIIQRHSLKMQSARAAVQTAVDELMRDFDMVVNWEGQVLRFKRSGVSGSLTLVEGEARLEVKLGMMLKAYASKIEDKLRRNMEKIFVS
jgi:putative polyhydroxyalkanoate system protein